MTGWRNAISATLHCLTGCALGEVLGMIIATAFGWSNSISIGISLGLAFLFGYGLTIYSLRGHGLTLKRRVGLALAADSVSISSMEVVDNGFIVIVPGALAAGLDTLLFWWSLAVSLIIAFVITVPVNRWLIARGKGHAVVHELHNSHA
jgi:hypothetical protein